MAGGISPGARGGVGLVGFCGERVRRICELPRVFGVWLPRHVAWGGDSRAAADVFAGAACVAAEVSRCGMADWSVSSRRDAEFADRVWSWASPIVGDGGEFGAGRDDHHDGGN